MDQTQFSSPRYSCMASGVWITERAMSELSHVTDWELLRFLGGFVLKDRYLNL